MKDQRPDTESAPAAGEQEDATAPRRGSELIPAPAVAQVREEDLEPHAGLRYIARLFKGLAVLIAFMLIAEVIIGLQQDGTAAIGLLLVQATRLVVFACFLWGAGDIALMLIEANHDQRASRILLGRINSKLENALAAGSGMPGAAPGGAARDMNAARGGAAAGGAADTRSGGTAGTAPDQPAGPAQPDRRSARR